MPSRTVSMHHVVLMAGLLLLMGVPAQAGGLAVAEQGVRSMGMAGAFLPGEQDAAAIFDNAAAIAFFKDHSFTLGGSADMTNVRLTGQAPFPGSAVEDEQTSTVRPRPQVSYVHPLSNRFVVGVGLHTPFQLATSWSNPLVFSGRFIAQDAQFVSRALTPSIGCRLADRLAFGAGIAIHFAGFEMQRHLPAINPFTFQTVDAAALHATSDTAWALSYRLGLVAKFTGGLAMTLAYDSRARLDLEGTGVFTRLPTSNAELDDRLALLLPKAPTAFHATMRLPALFGGSLGYRGNNWGVAADVRWQRWAALETFGPVFSEADSVSSEQPVLDSTLLRNFENRLQLRFGVERRVNAEWTLRAGFLHDPTPAPIESISPVFVDSNRNGVTVGATWSRGDLSVDLAQALQFYSQRSTMGINPEGYDGSYKSFRTVFGLSLGYRF